MPLVSVLLATHNDACFLAEAVESILRQTLADLELVVVDDASNDATAAVLAAVSDPRLQVLRNDEQVGLASALNRGLASAQGRYVARLDADDVALPNRLERQLARLAERDEPAIVGSAVLDIDGAGKPGTLHRNPSGPIGIRWQTLFGSPFFHPTVLIDRDRVERSRLRYDPSYLESEDYDLWTRLLTEVEGANLREPLVLKRVHAGQASLRRGDLQSSFQRQVALREIARVAPKLSEEDAKLAWQFGTGRADSQDAATAYLELLNAFEALYGIDREARDAAVRALLGAGHVSRALRLGVAHPGRLAVRGARRRLRARRVRPRAQSWLAGLDPTRDVRVAVVSPEPTPYRSPLFDRIGAQEGIDLTVIYAAATVADRTWSVQPGHQTEFLSGRRLPGLQRLLRHEYPVTPGIGQALARAHPDVVVVSGWSTFASQAAILWSRRHRIPYVLLVESHDLGPRAGWRRAVKGAVVPQLVRGAASVLAVGTAARESMIARGARPEDVRTFANTVDIPAWSDRASKLSREREALRTEAGFGADDIVVLSVGRLVPDKGMDTLARAAAATGDKRVRLVLVGRGSGRPALEALARELGVSLSTPGDLPQNALAKEYARADVFALLSLHETWGVVVNEAAVSGLPLVLSERVGAGRDLVRQGENGFVVPASDVDAAADALAQLAADAERRRAFGARSCELVSRWTYEESVESFLEAVRDATAR